MSAYQSVTPAVLTELAAIVGAGQLLSGAAIPDHYDHDEGTPPELRQSPAVVVYPADAAETAAIVRLANRWRLPVTPRGGGTGLAGGAVPYPGGILIDLSRLNRIIHIDTKARYLVAEASVRTSDIQKAAREQGLLYAGDPCSNDDCVIGGNIATNAGGNMAVKYGVTSDQVYQLEVVTPQGEIITLGGRLKKNSTGYALTRLIAGSEGTLGIITKAVLKLQPLPPVINNYLAVFSSIDAALATISAALDDSRIDPVSLELVDRYTLLGLEEYLQQSFFRDKSGDVIIIQIEAWSREESEQKFDRLKQILAAPGLLDLFAVNGDAIWQARRIWGTPNRLRQPIGVSEDFVVPVDSIRSLVRTIEELTAEFAFDFRLAGHAGDGNIHLRVQPGTIPEERWHQTLPQFQQKIYTAVYALGGRLSGEHGIGLKRKASLSRLIDPGELALMQALKQAFDPNHILNPGKIFDLPPVASQPDLPSGRGAGSGTAQ
ncbi:MAG: FAD-binding oxidoreductase [Sporomusaceae bacterium]|nr:FAD-binding oxidoreductase [Sporomusaceae bacterium]